MASSRPNNSASHQLSVSSANGNRTDSVVISGIGGRFPESDSVDEFARNLFGKVDMITKDNRRWPTGEYFVFF